MGIRSQKPAVPELKLNKRKRAPRQPSQSQTPKLFNQQHRLAVFIFVSQTTQAKTYTNLRLTFFGGWGGGGQARALIFVRLEETLSLLGLEAPPDAPQSGQ